MMGNGDISDEANLATISACPIEGELTQQSSLGSRRSPASFPRHYMHVRMVVFILGKYTHWFAMIGL